MQDSGRGGLVHIAGCNATLNDCKVVWLEEPFHAQAFHAYAKLADMAGNVRLAGGEGSHLPAMAKNLMDFGKVGFIQVDAGRIGGITSSFEVAKYAQQTGIQYVNHTFTTSLALSASLQPFAGMESSTLCEFPVESTELAQVLTTKRLLPNANGELEISDAPGLGLDIDWKQVERFALPVEIKVSGKTLWSMK